MSFKNPLSELFRDLSDIWKSSDIRQTVSTCDYDFCRFRKEIVGLMRFGFGNGLSDLVCAQVKIQDRGDDEYVANVAVYFRDGNGNPQKVDKSYEIHGFDQIPEAVRVGLKEKEAETITFELEDLKEFAKNADLKIGMKDYDLMSSAERISMKTCFKDDDKLLLKMRDFILYYRVTVVKRNADDGKDEYLGEFLTTNLEALPQKMQEKMAENHELIVAIPASTKKKRNSDFHEL